MPVCGVPQSPFIGVIADEAETRTGPKLQKSRPSGSTSHHLSVPSLCVRKRPVAASAGPFAQPPNAVRSAGPGCAARSFSSASRAAARSASPFVLPGHSRHLNCPNLSMHGRKSDVFIFIHGSESGGGSAFILFSNWPGR